jgi:hypothetical protein
LLAALCVLLVGLVSSAMAREEMPLQGEAI